MANRLPPTKRLTKMGPDNDVEVYLEIFDRTADRERRPADKWGHILAPLLTGEAHRAYRDLNPHQTGHYPTLKWAILSPGATLPRLDLRPAWLSKEPDLPPVRATASRAVAR